MSNLIRANGSHFFSTRIFHEFANKEESITNIEVVYETTKRFYLTIGLNNIRSEYDSCVMRDTEKYNSNLYDTMIKKRPEEGIFYYMKVDYMLW